MIFLLGLLAFLVVLLVGSYNSNFCIWVEKMKATVEDLWIFAVVIVVTLLVLWNVCFGFIAPPGYHVAGYSSDGTYYYEKDDN